MSPPQNVVVFSSINLDTFMTVQTLPRPGETILSTTLATALGGKGANTAVAATRAGGLAEAAGSVRLVAGVGDDEAADVLRARLVALGVSDSSLVRHAGPSGQATICVDGGGENFIIVHAGANARLVPSDLFSAIDAVDERSLLVLHLELDAHVVADAVRAARHAGATVALNASPVPRDGSCLLCAEGRDVWAHLDLLVVNGPELQALSGARARAVDVAEVAMQIARLRERLDVGRATVVVTRGGDGVVAARPDGSVLAFDALPVDKVVNTTGAGDCFLGFLSALLAAGRPFADATRTAVAASGLVVGRDGAADAMPDAAEVRAALERVGPAREVTGA